MIREMNQKSNVGEMSYTQFIPVCDKCDCKMIEVARSFNVPFYSCHNEDCDNYAELMINTGNEQTPMMVGFYEMIKAMNNISEDNVEEDNVEEDNVEEDNVEEDNVEEDNVEESVDE